MSTPRGSTRMRLKSAVVSDSPSVVMISASATGSATVANGEASCIERAMVAGLGLGRLQAPRHRGYPHPPAEIAGCEDCLREGTRWVHLRMCQECGHIGC